MSLRKTAAGFSIVELVFVVFIVAILAGVGVPTLRAALDRNAIASEKMLLYRSLNFARTEATNKKLNVTVASRSGNRDWSTGWTITLNGDTDTLLRDFNLQTNTLTILSSEDAGASFSFNEQGLLLTNGTPSFAVCDIAMSNRVDGSAITISRTGRPNIEEIPAGEKAARCSP